MKHKTIFLFFFSFQLLFNCSFSQSKKLDSLQKLLPAATDDSNKANLLNDLGWQLKSDKPQEALQYENQALVLSKKLLKSVSSQRDITELKIKTGISHRNIALAHQYLGNYEKAMEHYLAALKAWEEVKYRLGIANAYVAGDPGKINISGATYAHLVETHNYASLQFKHRGKIPAKNKGEIEMYFVERNSI